MTTEEKFHAAVNVIRNLPKNGAYQPSNELMLRFYSYYKQATEGPCQQSKPAFWEVVKKAKWDAWMRLGNMGRVEAMNNYVDELKKIVETMSYTDNVANFLGSLDSFYDSVPAEDLEMLVGPVLEKIRSQPGSPLSGSPIGSRETSPHRVRGTSRHITSSLETSPASSHSASPLPPDTDGEEEVFIDTVESAPSERSNKEIIGSKYSSNNTTTMQQQQQQQQQSSSSSNNIKNGKMMMNGQATIVKESNSVNTVNNKNNKQKEKEDQEEEEEVEDEEEEDEEENELTIENNTSNNKNGQIYNNKINNNDDILKIERGRSRERKDDKDKKNIEFLNQITATVQNLQRDLDRITARVRSLEGHALNALSPQSASSSKRSNERRYSKWWPIPECSPRMLAVIILWPFIAHAVISIAQRSRQRKL